jgi:hypothetical protein
MLLDPHAIVKAIAFLGRIRRISTLSRFRREDT